MTVFELIKELVDYPAGAEVFAGVGLKEAGSTLSFPEPPKEEWA